MSTLGGTGGQPLLSGLWAPGCPPRPALHSLQPLLAPQGILGPAGYGAELDARAECEGTLPDSACPLGVQGSSGSTGCSLGRSLPSVCGCFHPDLSFQPRPKWLCFLTNNVGAIVWTSAGAGGTKLKPAQDRKAAPHTPWWLGHASPACGRRCHVSRAAGPQVPSPWVNRYLGHPTSHPGVQCLALSLSFISVGQAITRIRVPKGPCRRPIMPCSGHCPLGAKRALAIGKSQWSRPGSQGLGDGWAGVAD